MTIKEIHRQNSYPNADVIDILFYTFYKICSDAFVLLLFYACETPGDRGSLSVDDFVLVLVTEVLEELVLLPGAPGR